MQIGVVSTSTAYIITFSMHTGSHLQGTTGLDLGKASKVQAAVAKADKAGLYPASLPACM